MSIMIIKSPFNGTIPKIHPTAFIAPSVVIIGDVRIRAYTNIWFNAVLRGDWGALEIGQNTSIQENVVIHSRPNAVCKIGNNVRLGHSCMCHGPCIIGDYALVGIHASVLDGANLGKGSVLAGGSVLRSKTEDFSLYAGIPAIKKKKYPNKSLNEFSSNIYVENGQKFKRAGYNQKIPEEYILKD
jgi:carbonic anhydrase/acetyltransferase-like protein (isoleucine patch superfamily)